MTLQLFVHLSKRIKSAQTIKPTAEEAQAGSISGTVTAAHNVSHQAAQKSMIVIIPLASLILSSHATRIRTPAASTQA